MRELFSLIEEITNSSSTQQEFLTEGYSREDLWNEFKPRIKAAVERRDHNSHRRGPGGSQLDAPYSDDSVIANDVREFFQGYHNEEAQIRDDFMGALEASVGNNKMLVRPLLATYVNSNLPRLEDTLTGTADKFKQYNWLRNEKHVDSSLRMLGVEQDGKVTPHENMTGPSHRDFNKIETEDQLNSIINHPNYDAANAEYNRRKFEKALKNVKPGVDYNIVEDNPHLRAYEALTHAGLKALSFDPHTGKKATWCNAADSKTGEMYFDSFQENGGNPFVIHYKHPEEYEEENIQQIHFGSREHKDMENQALELDGNHYSQVDNSLSDISKNGGLYQKLLHRNFQQMAESLHRRDQKMKLPFDVSEEYDSAFRGHVSRKLDEIHTNPELGYLDQHLQRTLTTKGVDHFHFWNDVKTHYSKLIRLYGSETTEPESTWEHGPPPGHEDDDIHEETATGAPINNVGDGNIAGAGVGPEGEPGNAKTRLFLLKRKRNRQVYSESSWTPEKP